MSKRIYGIFDDEEILKDGIVKLKEQGVVCKDVQSPFPVHGIEHLLNIPRTRISIASFMWSKKYFRIISRISPTKGFRRR